MKPVTRMQTFDGAVHDNYDAAKRHLDRAYGDLLLNLARTLVPLNYTDTAAFINARLADFTHLKTIRDDFAVEPLDQDETI